MSLQELLVGDGRAARRSRSRCRWTPTCCWWTRCSRSATPSFQQKCFGEFDRLKAEGRTIVFVTHDMASVERFCDRAMLLDRGRVVDIGPAEEISRAYSEVNLARRADLRAASRSPGPFQIARRLVRGRRRQADRHPAAGPALPRVPGGRVRQDVDDPSFGIAFRNEARHPVFAAHSGAHGPSGALRGRRAGGRGLRASRICLPPGATT